MQVCTSLQRDKHASTPPLSFLQARCPSCHPTNNVKALNAEYCYIFKNISAAIYSISVIQTSPSPISICCVISNNFFVVQCCSCCNVLRLFADFCQNYTLRYRVSDGRYSNVTKVVIYIASSNMYPPRFSVPVYSVTGIIEKDQSAVNSLLTTVSHTHLCIYCLYGSITMLLAGLTSLSVWSSMVYYYFLKSCISSLHLVAEECVYFHEKICIC